MSNDRINVWNYSTTNFKVVCDAELLPYIDRMIVNNEMDAVHEGRAAVEHLHASIFFRGIEIANVSKRNCVYSNVSPWDETDDEIFRTMSVLRRILFLDRRHLNQVVKLAIKEARKELSGLYLPDLRLRRA